MSTFGIFLLLAIAALAQALPQFNKNQQNRLTSFPNHLVAKSGSFLQNIIQSNAKGQDICDTCENFILKVVEIIRDPKILQQCHDGAQKVCDAYLLEKQRCEQLKILCDTVRYKLDYDIYLLGGPEGICTCELKACNDTTGECALSTADGFTLSNFLQNTIQSKAKEQDLCERCENFIVKVEETIQDPKLLQQCHDKVQAVCDGYLLEKHRCDEVKLVCDNVLYILDWIVGSPEGICACGLKVCNDTTGQCGDSTADRLTLSNFLQNTIRSKAKGQDLCGKCEQFSDSATTLLVDPKTVQKVNDTVRQVCSALSLSDDSCLQLGQLVAAYYYYLLQFISDPLELCTCELKVCKDTEDKCDNSINNRLPLLISSKISKDIHKFLPINKIDTCSICTSALNELKAQLDNPDVVAQLKDAVQQICKYTGAHESQCNDAAKDYFQQIRQALAQPEQTCNDAKLCP